MLCCPLPPNLPFASSMTLLERITKAASASINQQTPHSPQPNFPVILNSDAILLNLKPVDAEDDQADAADSEDQITLIKRVHGWKLSESDSDLIEIGSHFCKKLKRKLKNPSLNKDEFLSLFDSFLEKNREMLNLSDKNVLVHSRSIAMKKLGFLVTPNVASLVLEGCLVLETWDLLETLIVEGVAGRFSCSNLIQSLIKKKKSDLICLCVKHFEDIGSSEALSVLNYFLSPPKGTRATMKTVRKKWEQQALKAVEKASSDDCAKQASLLLMVAYDDFSSAELCMHFLFASDKFDELTLSYCLSGLDGSDMLKLVRYFGKWINKYSNYPQAAPYPRAASGLGLELCEWVPSLESVVKHLGLVLDEHFSSLVLYSEFHEELKLLEEGVLSLASEAGFCCSLANVVENLKLDIKHR